MIPPTITFDKDAINEILYCFDKSIDNEGYVTDENNHRVLAMDGKEIKADDIGGIVNVGGIPTIVRKGHFDSKWNPVNQKCSPHVTLAQNDKNFVTLMGVSVHMATPVGGADL